MLNEQQQRAASHMKGPLLILAGAGSGKTTVLKHRVRNLLQSGVPTQEILVVSFTRDAAREMRERLSDFLGESMAKELTVRTFHSLCLHILKEQQCEQRKVEPVKQIFLLSRFLRQHSLQFPSLSAVKPKEAAMYISLFKNKGLTPKALRTEESPWDGMKEGKFQHVFQYMKRRILPLIWDGMIAVYDSYQQHLLSQGLMDFDDMIIAVLELFRSRKDILAMYQKRYRYVMVDEFQDSSMAQTLLLHDLCSRHRNLAVVGDDWQSIYRFRGSDMGNILSFEEDYPDATVVKLEENFRCSPVILQAANEIIKNNPNQKEKQLFTSKSLEGVEKIGYCYAHNDAEEIRFVIRKIRELFRKGIQYGEIAILARTSSQLEPFMEKLNRISIPTHCTASSSLLSSDWYHAAVRVIGQFLRPAEFSSAADWFSFGCPERFAEEVYEFANLLTSLEDVQIGWDVMNDRGNSPRHKELREGLQSLPPAAYTFFYHRYKWVLQSLEWRSMSATQWFSLWWTCGIPFNGKTEQDKKEQEEWMSELFLLCMEVEAMYPCADLRTFADSLSHMEQLEQQLSRKGVQLMTVHASKGLEFRVVFLVGFEEGLFPHHRSLREDAVEEERRLCYVAITRAKEKLFVSHAQQRTTFGKTTQQTPSRFLYECDEGLFDGPIVEKAT